MYSSIRIQRRFCTVCLPGILLGGLVLISSLSIAPADAGELGDSPNESCRSFVERSLIEERDAYRRVQYSDEYISVLDAEGARTTALVPYLVMNYHGLSCRLRSLCLAVGKSVSPFGDWLVDPTRPLGCSPVYAARGRWWSDARRETGFNDGPIRECTYRTVDDQLGASLIDTAIINECDASVEKILEEERAFLRVFVAQDATHRGIRLVSGVFQSALMDIRDGFLHPLRGVVDLFGSVLHPIPCVLSQCN